MKKILALTVCTLLAGCSDADWNKALNYTGMGDDSTAAEAPVQEAPVQQAPATAAAAPAQEDSFCRDVATQDATGSGFDPQTQARVYARSYGQCMMIYTR